MNDTPSPSPRARLQELLASPDRNRTDAEWDELNELEIALASGNRPGAPDPQSRQNHQRQNAGAPGRMQQPGGGRPQGQNKNPAGGKKFHKRSKRRGSGGGGNGGGNVGGSGGGNVGGGGGIPQPQ